MNQSEDIKDLVTALAKAQGSMKPAIFNKGNPHFKSRYADFTSCMDACRAPLSENGLSIMQYCETVENRFLLVTMLAHVSGQWIKSHFPLYPKTMDSQGIGAAMTYAKRYSLSSLIGLVSDDDDDDGEREQGRGQSNYVAKPAEPVAPEKPVDYITPQQVLELEAAFVGCDDLKATTLKHYKKMTLIPAKSFGDLMKRIASVKAAINKEEEFPF